MLYFVVVVLWRPLQVRRQFVMFVVVVVIRGSALTMRFFD
jgi:hypothetical protein